MDDNLTSKESVYTYTYSQGEDLKNTGYDYSEKIMTNSLSNYMFRNDTVSGFLTYVNDIFYEYIEAVKKVRVYYNFTVDKDYKKIQ
jgi:hypothetical protein